MVTSPWKSRTAELGRSPWAPAPSLRRPVCPGVCGHQRILSPGKGLFLLSPPTRPQTIGRDRADRVPGVTELTAWWSVTLCAPALPRATATVQPSAESLLLSCLEDLRGSSKPARFSGVPPFAPQTRLSTFSVSGAGGAREQVQGWPQPPEPEASKRG